MPRLNELQKLYQTALDSIDEVEPDKRASLIKECRFLLQEIEQLQADVPNEKKSPLDELMEKRKAKSA